MSDVTTPTPATAGAHTTFGKSPYSTLLADVSQRQLLLQGRATLSSDDILSTCREERAWHETSIGHPVAAPPRHNYVNIASDFHAWLHSNDAEALLMRHDVSDRSRFGTTLPGHAFDDNDVTLVVSIDDAQTLHVPQLQMRARSHTNDVTRSHWVDPAAQCNLRLKHRVLAPQDWIAPTDFSQKAHKHKKQTHLALPVTSSRKSRRSFGAHLQPGREKSPTSSSTSVSSFYSSGSLARKTSFGAQARKFVADGFGTLSADVRRLAKSVRSRAVSRPHFRQMSLVEKATLTPSAAWQPCSDVTPVYASVTKNKLTHVPPSRPAGSECTSLAMPQAPAVARPKFFTGDVIVLSL